MEGIMWLVILAVLLVIEIITLGLTTIWFAIGALAAFIATLFNAPMAVQIALFVAVSILLVISTRPLATRYLNNQTIKTNIDSLIGKVTTVVESIDNINAKGKVIINGIEWMARSTDGTAIPKGNLVEIMEIQGAKLIVAQKEEDIDE